MPKRPVDTQLDTVQESPAITKEWLLRGVNRFLNELLHWDQKGKRPIQECYVNDPDPKKITEVVIDLPTPGGEGIKLLEDAGFQGTKYHVMFGQCMAIEHYRLILPLNVLAKYANMRTSKSNPNKHTPGQQIPHLDTVKNAISAALKLINPESEQR